MTILSNCNVVVFDKDHLAGRALGSLVNKNTSFHLLKIVSMENDLLKILESESVDLLFMDILSDGVPNFALLKQLHKIYINTSVVIVSAYDDYEGMMSTISYGVKNYIIKPITILKVNKVLSALEPKEEESGRMVEMIRELVMNKNFNDVYNSLEKVREMSVEWFKSTGSKESTVAQISEEMFYLINATNKANQLHFRKKLKLDEMSLQYQYPDLFILFNVFDEIYKQRTIQKKPQLAQFFNYIDANIYEDLSLNETAEKCSISQGYLSRIFKENYSTGFNTYIQMKKVQLAKQRFFYNDSKIIDVSFQLSYSEPSYFCKVFKKIEKITPLQLKKEMVKSYSWS